MTIEISLEVKEIIFDIQNKTYLTGRSRESEEARGFEAASNMQASDDDENSYQIRRSVSNAFAQLKTELADYMSSTQTTADNLVNETVDSGETLEIALEMPSNFNAAATDNLGSSLHQFLVCKAIYDWFTITNKPDAADYETLSKQALDVAKRALCKRIRPTRPQLRPISPL